MEEKNLEQDKVLEKAARLAEAMKETRTFQEFYNRYGALEEDEAAQDLLYEFDCLRQEVMKNQRQGAVDPDDAARLHSLQQQIQGLDLFQQYQQAWQQAVALVRELGQELSAELGVPFDELIRPPAAGGFHSHAPSGCSSHSGCASHQGCTSAGDGCGCGC